MKRIAKLYGTNLVFDDQLGLIIYWLSANIDSESVIDLGKCPMKNFGSWSSTLLVSVSVVGRVRVSKVKLLSLVIKSVV